MTSSSPFAAPAPAACLRLRVERFDDLYIYGTTSEGESVRLHYATVNAYGDWQPLRAQLYQGCTLHAVEPTKAADGTTEAQLYIFEPDLLADISAVASCFDTGSAQQVLISRFRPSPANKTSILLGNFASQLLDECLARPLALPSYADSIRSFVRRNALAFAAADDLKDFHTLARAQRSNILRTVRSDMQATAPAFSAAKAMLEPTFFCQLLGLQGRMDLLQDDGRVLIEQKSGAKDWRGGHRRPHYVQMLLYLAILHFGFGQTDAATAAFLYYSKYVDGLIRETADKQLIGDALRMRNAIISDDLSLCTADGCQRLLRLQPDDLRQNPSISDRFWQQWKRPEIASTLNALQAAAPLEQAYFLRLLRFVSLESILSRTDTAQAGRESMASLWLVPPAELAENGSLLFPLKLEECLHNADGAASALRLSGEAETLSASNFRSGDTAIIFAVTPGQSPDVRRSILWRGHIETLSDSELTLRLRNPQQNTQPFPLQAHYALVHDPAELSRPLLRGLFSFLTCPARRRDLLLARRLPTLMPMAKDEEKETAQVQTTAQRIAAAARGKELFLLIGPPGSGKTSLGLMSILRDTLARTDESVLLTAYTNRAVDEICSKLLEADLPFLRIGGERNMPEACRPFLLSEKASALDKLSDVRSLIASARIIVGTTAAIAAAPHLFQLKTFGLCIADEASQLLEPHLLPLLCATHGDDVAIRRFVLIGDHRQLPAVVRQDRADSAADTEVLHAIGLQDCRESFYWRMLRWLGEDSPFVWRMELQGRMHPAVSQFPSATFYGGRLASAGLPHQEAPLPFDSNLQLPPLCQQLSVARFHFFDVEPSEACTARSNTAEARAVARLCAAWWRLWTANGHTFIPDESLGVIVPYRAQIALVRHYLFEEVERLRTEGLDATALTSVSIDTVERYQGSQREAIVYSFTAATPQQLDFLTAETFTDSDGTLIDRKLNVALTRARLQCFVTGHSTLLKTAELPARLIAYCQQRGEYSTL